MAYGICQRCGWQYHLSELRKEWTNLRVCPSCHDPRPAYLSPPRVKPEGVPLPNAAPEPPSKITVVATLDFNTADQTTDASGNSVLDVSSLTVVQNDVFLVIYNLPSTADRNLTATGNVMGAYEELADLKSNDTRDVNLGVFISPQDDAPDTTITINGETSGVIWAARVIQLRGVDSVNPIDVTTTTATGSNSDLANPPAITPENPGAKIIAIYASVQVGADAAWTAPANVSDFTQFRTNRTSGTDTEPMIGTGFHDWTSGEFDPDAVTGGSASTDYSWAAATVALKLAG